MGYEPLFQVLSMALVATVAIIAVNIPYGLLYFLNLKGEGLLDRYLLQPKRKEATQWTRGQWWKAFWVTVTNYILVYVVTFLNGPITAYFRPDFFERDMLWSPVPGVAQWAIDMLRGVIVEDFVFYFLHRALHHYPVLYTSIHKMHHEYKAPFHMTAMYATVTHSCAVSSPPVTGPQPLVLWPTASISPVRLIRDTLSLGLSTISSIQWASISSRDPSTMMHIMRRHTVTSLPTSTSGIGSWGLQSIVLLTGLMLITVHSNSTKQRSRTIR